MTEIRSFWPTDDIPPSGWFEDGNLVCVMRLRPEVKTLWVQAMRSGHYIQGTGWLRRLGAPHPTVTAEIPGSKPCWCCLGIRCDVAHRAGALPRPREGTCAGTIHVFTWEGDSDYANPGPLEKAWAYGVSDQGEPGSSSMLAFELAEATDNQLAIMNDGRHQEGTIAEIAPWPLARIAGWVEEHL